MDRQKLPPPVSTKITRKLASESTEHNSLLNFYSSISTDETGAPKRWKMSSNVQYDEELISSGKSSPVPTKGSSRDNSSDRKGRPGPKKGWKERESTDNASSRESSLDIKEKGKGSSELKRESSNDSVKGRRSEENTSRSKSVDKVKFYGATGSKVNGSTPQVKRKGRPKSLDLNSKLANGEDESFKSPDPLTPCNIAVKRKKGRPKETPPTLVAESPVDVVNSENTEQKDVSEPKEIMGTGTNVDSEKIYADVEDSSVSNVKKKKGRPKDKTKITNLTSKSKLITAHKLLGQRKGLKGPKVLSKLKGMKAFKKAKQQGTSKTMDEKPEQSEVIKRKGRGRPPGAKNKSTLLKEQMMAKQLEDQEKQHLENLDSDSQKQSVDTSASDNDKSITQTGDEKTEQVSEKSDNSNSYPKEDQNSVQISEDKTISDQTIEATTAELPVPERENSNSPDSDFVKVKKAKGRKPLRLKKGGVKSIGKLKKEEIENKKVRKKRILNSYTGSGESGSSLDHLPKNDLRRYLQMKLIERLSGNRSTSHNLVKPAVDPQLVSPSCDLVMKGDTDEVYSEEDSLPAIDPARDNDIQNLSALVEQKRVRTESDASDKPRRSASRSRKSSVDLSKISDNESVSSEISTNSVSSAKRIFILGEDKSETDDSIRTRQRVEIVPGKSRKRTLSGEFDLVDEHQLRKEKKMARKSGSVDIPTNNDDDAIFNEVTPVTSPIKVKKKTSPKLVAIKQKLDAQIEKSIPFASQVRKRLLKQSPFLTRMRRKKKRKPENRGLSPNKIQHVVSDIMLSTGSTNLQDTVLKTDSVSDQNIETDTSSIETDTNNSNNLHIQDNVLNIKENDIGSSSDKALITVENHDLDEKVKDKIDIDLDKLSGDKVLMDEHSEVKAIEDKMIKDEDTEVKPFSIETEVEDILNGLITKVLAMNNSAKDESSLDQNVVTDSTMLDTPLLSNEQFESVGARGRGGKRKGRPRKIKRHFGRQKIKIPTVRTTVVRTGAKRGRKPKSAKPLESPETASVKASDSTNVRTFELRQKISRSPLDNIALKQSIEESEYYKSEVQRANKKEAKLLKSKRSQVIAPEETLTPVSLIPYEPAPSLIDTSLNDTVTDTATETGTTDSELSDTDVETPDPPKTTEDYLRECRPCSVVLKDFFQQLQRAQQHPDTQDDESATETEDFGEDVNEIYGDKQTDVRNQSSMDEVSENSMNKLSNEVPEQDNVIDKAPSKPLNSPNTLNKKELKRQTTFSSSQVEELNSVSPKGDKIKSPHGKKKTSSPKTPKSMPEHQTARKTVPPLKIKLKVGINKTYMVESSTVGEEPGDSQPLHKPVKKKKKSSSKSGSDSDRGNKSHHHHHHKKRNKSPLVGPLGSLTEKKSKPTAIVAASPSVKPPPVPKDPYEATFLEFIQNKEKDMAMTQAPVLGKVRPVYDHPKLKEMQVTMTTASISSQSAVISSLSTLTDKQSPVSLYNSISKNTSLVNSYINDNLKKSMENAVDVSKKKEGPLFIGVVGTKGNAKYFCSHCENEVHDLEELVVKHFALVHPGAGIMYRRVADTQPSEQLGTSSVIDVTSQSAVPSISSTVAGINGGTLLADKTTGDQLTGQDQSNSELKTSPENHNRESSLKRDDDTESDAGSLNLKIVEVVSLKDQEDNVIDVEESAPQVESSQKVQEKTNNVVQPELKIPQFQRSTHSTVQPNLQPHVQPHVKPQVQTNVQPHVQPHLQQGNVAKSSHHNEQILQTYPSTKPLQRKPPGLITPGKFRNTFKCEKCNVHAPVLGAMVAHLRNSHTDIPRLFQCPYCRDIEAETEALIHQHIRKKHPTDNLNPPVALSEKAKSNLRTLSVRVPDSKANDASFLEKDIYMCLNCKVHMPSLEAIYDHLERVHTEVFVFVCSACKIFKSKTEQDVLVHCQTDPVCRTREKNISLAIDGNQFIRVPCLIKEKNKNKSLTQQTKPPQQQSKVPSQPHASQVQSIKQQISQLNKHNTNTPANSIVQALQKQSITPAQIMQHGLNMQQYFQQQFAPMIAPAPVTQPASGALIQQPGLLSAPLVLSQPPTLGSQPVLVSPTAIVPQVNLATQPTLAPQSFLLQPTPVPQHPTLIPPSSVSRTPASQQPVFPHPSLAASTPSTTVSSSTPTLTSVTTTSSSASSVATSSNKPSVSPAPPKPTGAKKRKNLLESIQHIKMQKQREQMAKMEKLESDSASERDYLSPRSDTAVDALSSTPSPVPVQSESGSNNQAPPPLIRGPPPLIRFDQLNQVSLSAAVPMQSGASQQAVKQISSPLQLSKSDMTKQSLPPRQIQSSLFDTSDPEAFKPVQRTPVLNVPSVPRSNRSPAVNLSSPKPTQLKPGGTPLDLSRTPPTNSPASSPGLTPQDKPVNQNKLDIPNPDMYSVFNLKPSTQAQLPKEALQSRLGVHQLPQKVAGPPQTVRPNTANTLAYRPPHPHVSTTQVPQVINMPLGMLNNMGNVVVSMPSFQLVQNMPAQFIRMTGAQLITSPGNQVPVNVSVAMPTATATRPTPATQTSTFQPKMTDTFKCPYCPKVVPLTYAQVKPHIDSNHPGCSVMYKPVELQ